MTESIKALEKLEESEGRYRLIAEQSRDLIALLDRNGVCTYASPSHFYLLGYHVEDVIGKKSKRIFIKMIENIFRISCLRVSY
ncbi:PAS domain-containing protein [Bacillus coahuilensis]|uniref:PAS domain S-box protein n=1 Tax=Bacillus coahuilensis TaxID=408580 RepID=UPI0009E69FDB